MMMEEEELDDIGRGGAGWRSSTVGNGSKSSSGGAPQSTDSSSTSSSSSSSSLLQPPPPHLQYYGLLVPPQLIVTAAGLCEEIPIDPRDFEETRFELRSSGHNLTSVLVNPRESSLMGDLMDDYASEQSTPLDYYAATTPSAMSYSSTHSSHKKAMTAVALAAATGINSNQSNSIAVVNVVAKDSSVSHSSSAKHMPEGSVRSSSESFWKLQLTALEELQLQSFLERMKGPYERLVKARAGTGFLRDKSHSRGISSNPSNNVSNSSPNSTQSSYKISNLNIPEYLYSPDFSLTNPQLFDKILLTSSNISSSSSSSNSDGDTSINNSNSNSINNQSRSSSWGHSDHLNKLLDSVELTLLHNIWEKASDFFKVLDDVRTLQTLVVQVSQRITKLRKRIDDLCSQLSLTAMRIPRLHTRQVNERALHLKLQSMQKVLAGRQTIQALLDLEDFGEALEVVSACKRTFQEELRDIKVMHIVGMQLDDFDLFICDLMTNKFISLATQWVVEESAGGDDLDVTSQMVSNNPNPNHAAFGRLVETLINVGKFSSTLSMYKSRVADSLRLIIRACVLEYASAFDPMNSLAADSTDASTPGSGDSNGNSNLAGRVRQMSAENFLSCLSMCYEQIVGALKRADSVDRSIQTILHVGLSRDQLNSEASYKSNEINESSSKNYNSSSSSSSSDIAELEALESSLSTVHKQRSESNDINGTIKGANPKIQFSLNQSTFDALTSSSHQCLAASCEAAQKSVSQLLSLRKDSSSGASRINVDKMKFLWEISASFIDSLEGIMDASAYTMRQTLLGHSKAYIDQLHESNKASMVMTMDNERWAQYDVSQERQAEIERLVTGRMFSSSSSSSTISSSSSSSSVNSSNNNTGNYSAVYQSLGSSNGVGVAREDKASKSKECRPLVMDGGAQFNIVHSVLYLIELIMSYIDISFAFPPATGEIISKCIDLLRLFDSRTRQLVLGAQAIQSTRLGLKSISAKHLALTAQSIGLMKCLLPHIRTALLAQLPPKQHLMLVEFDRLSHELVDHHGQIVTKFVSIVSDMTDGLIGKLKSVNWDKLQGTCDYFEDIVKNVSILHRVLISILPPEQLQHIFSRIFSLLNRKITQHFEEIMPLTTTGKQRIIDEIVHLAASFSQLKGLQGPATTALEEAFRQKYGGIANI